MLAPTKTLLGLGAVVETWRARQRLTRHQDATAQARVLRSLLGPLARTTYGKAHGITAGLTYGAFAARVPVRTPDRFAPYLERMARGEADVLWPGMCDTYACSPGTSGERKRVPLTPALRAHLVEAARQALLYYAVRAGRSRVLRARQLWLHSGDTLAAFAPAAREGDLITALRSGCPAGAEPSHGFEPLPGPPDPTLSAGLDRFLSDPRDPTLLLGLPSWLWLLAQRAAEAPGVSRSPLAQFFPHVDVVVHSGAPLAPFAEALRQAMGPVPQFHEIYAATEGIFAAQDGEPAAGLRLITDAGIFFEFIPLADLNSRQELSSATAVPVEGVQPGVEYAVVITTPAGLTRYLLGDIVRFTSVQPPRLQLLGRWDLRLNAFDEGVHERDVTEALVAVCRQHQWQVVNFHVAPFFSTTATMQRRGRHEWWVELRPGTTETPTGPLMGVELDVELQRLSPSYAARRRSTMDSPYVRLVMPGVFEQWMRRAGHWSPLHKMPRCRSDRLVADELGQLAPFSAH